VKQWVKINTDRKRSSYVEKDCFEKPCNYCSTGESRTEYSSWRPCFHKNVDMSFTNPASKVGLQLLNLWLLKVMLRFIIDGVMTIKPGHQTNWNMCMVWSDESSFMLFATSGRDYIWRAPKEAYNLECLVLRVKHGGDSVTVWAAILWYSILLVPLLPFMAEILQGSTWTGWVISHIPWSRFYFWNNDAVFKTISPFTQLERFKSWSEEHEGELQYLHTDQHNHQIWTSSNHPGQFWRLEWGTDSHLQHL
jgi:hypothetical protein